MNKTIFRTEKNAENPFVMIDRRPIEKPELSWKAKGILAYLLSRPDNWTVRLGDLIKRSPDGVSAVRAALRELTKAGHITRKEEREAGRFKQYVLIVHELPLTEKPQAEKPQAENLMLNNTNINENELNNISANAVLDMQKITEQANRKVEAILAQKPPEGVWPGRDLIPPHLLKYADWWHSKTGQVMRGKPNKEWLKAFNTLYENEVSVSSCEEAYNSDVKWKGVISKPSEIVVKAVAIQALPKKEVPTSKSRFERLVRDE